MRAHEITFFKLIEGDKQFQVPLYQRTYSWQTKDWVRLWKDLLEQVDILAEGAHRTPHFIGSVVLAPGTMTAADVQQWLVVDGQQRLTTLMLACCALRDRFREVAGREADRIHKQYLVNEYREGLKHYRLLPTQADRDAYVACVEHQPKAGGADPVGAAYRFFRSALIDFDPDGDVEALQRVEAALRGRLSVVEITADHGDNVYRIFESLNNTGVKLSQTDLLRNFVFMALPRLGERVYAHDWLPMQQELGPANLELLAWLDLVIRGDYRARQSEIYRDQQVRMQKVVETGGEDALHREIAELHRRGRLLLRILEPAREEHQGLRKALERLQEWGGQSVFPIALHLLDLIDHSQASSEQAAQALGYVESFLVRRMICGIPTNNLNRILNSAPKELETGRPVDEAIHRYLSGRRRYWPTDEQLRTNIRARPFYWTGRPGQRFFVLKRLEQSYGAKEPVDFDSAKLTIEHVMPQTATKEWLELLSREVTDEGGPGELHGSLLHTLGNLTLTAENSRLSNHPFKRKQEIFDASALRMNREIASTERWGKREILARSTALAERAIQLWPAPLTGGANLEDERRTWVLLRQILAELPAGSWTTFGDLATVIGGHPGGIGTYMIARPDLENMHRVLTSEGAVSTAFPWPDDRTETPQEVLEREGVTFTAGGKANPAQRLSGADLAELVGIEVEETNAPVSDDPADRRNRFQAQLTHQGPNIAETVGQLVGYWASKGGDVTFGAGRDTGCFLILNRTHGRGSIWLLVLYPVIGRIEVGFQHLARRPPFDDVALRRELMNRLNQIPGVEIPEAKIALRPSFPMIALTGSDADRLHSVLDWFITQVQQADAQQS
jgi:alkylated DNA nucleotide flippase Atl1